MTAAEWIAKRREIEQAATDGPWMSEWDTSDQWWTIHGQPNPTKGDERMVCPEVATLQHSEDWTADVDFITDTRTSLPRALDALEAVLKGHRPVSFSFSWRDGIAMHEVCPGCQDKAGTHPCGCWRAEDQPHVCAVCSDPEHHIDAPWPCMTVQTIETALGGES